MTRQSDRASNRFARTYYGVLGLHPAATPIAIRRAYRDLSKRYHPDTTELPVEVATARFQALNAAYATLSNPQARALYDRQIGYSRLNVIQSPAPTSTATARGAYKTYQGPSDRPLSSGEIVALLALGLTLFGCLLLAIAIALTRGDAAFTVPEWNTTPLRTPAGAAVPTASAATVSDFALSAPPLPARDRPL